MESLYSWQECINQRENSRSQYDYYRAKVLNFIIFLREFEQVDSLKNSKDSAKIKRNEEKFKEWSDLYSKQVMICKFSKECVHFFYSRTLC